MKLTFRELEGCFAVEMEAETMQDAILLARFATNRTEKVRHAGAAFNSDGTASGSIVLGKQKNPTSMIP